MKELHDIIQILVLIAKKQDPLINDIIKDTQLDKTIVMNNIQLLIDNNYIKQINNHYHLIKEPKQYLIIDLFDIVKPMSSIPCLNHEQCELYDDCPVTCFWYGMNKEIREYVNMYTLEDLVKGYCL